MKQPQLFGAETQLEKLSKMGDSLEKINSIIDWEMFRDTLEKYVRKNDYSKGGRPPFDVILMFKIIILQQWYGLSDEGAEYVINDRLSFMRFLGLSCGEKVPDENTIWNFKQALQKDDVIRKLFDLLNTKLEEKEIITHKGSIIDATFVTVPKRHTTKKEDEIIKTGQFPLDYAKRKAEQKINLADSVSQTDFDARWAKKGDEAFFGYKDHVKCDEESKIITNYSVTSANVHDVKEYVDLIDEKDRNLKLDAGYVGERRLSVVAAFFPELKVEICARAYRGNPLTEKQKDSNREISRKRCRIEHIFGYMTKFMAGITSRVHGIDRIKRDVGCKNLAYNLKRIVCLAG